MPLERPRLAPTPSAACTEAGCDRPAAAGDERCALHQQRLGARPSQPSSPRLAPVIVETALDASVAVPRRAPPDRAERYRQGLLAFALGAAGFWADLLFGFGVNLKFDATGNAFLALLLLLGGAATWGGATCIRSSTSTTRRALGIVLFLLALVPEALAALFFLVALLEHGLYGI